MHRVGQHVLLCGLHGQLQQCQVARGESHGTQAAGCCEQSTGVSCAMGVHILC
jgi:hypothetical protein